MQFFRSRILAKPIAIAMSLLMSMPFTVLADDGAIARSASSAQQLGSQVSEWFSPVDAQATLEDVFVDYRAMGTEDLESVFGEDTETRELGQDAQTRLNTEASNEGEAYRTVLASGRRITPDMSNDPMFNSADQIRSGEYMDYFRNEFSDCSRKDVFEDVEKSVHMPKYETCERINNYGQKSEISHDYSVGIIEYLSGQPNYQSCGRGCLHVWVGTVGDDYWAGNCKVYEQNTAFRLINREAVTSVTLERAVFDDYFQVYLNNKKVWSHTPGVFPPETPGRCERNTSWKVSPGHNITHDFLQSGDTIIFKTRTSVSGNGEGYARIRINFDPEKAFSSNGWGPEKSQKTLDMISDGFCPDHTAQCTSMPDVDSSGCLTVSGVTICESDVGLLPINGLSPFCQKAALDASCNFNEGAMDCWTDLNGNQQCPVNDDPQQDTCKAMEENPECGFVSQKCIEGASGESETCYAYSEVWDCGYEARYPTSVNTGSKIECPGGAVCMGTECFDDSNTKSGDFAYAVAMLQVAQFAEHDMECGGDPEDLTQDNTCTVFPGQAMECKKALGGYVDCCEAPDGVSLFDYVNLTMNTLKMSSQVEALSRSGSLFAPGYWQAAKAAAGSVGSSVVKGNWGGIVDAATGSFTETLAGEVALGKLEQFLMQTAYDAMQEMGATAAADAVFSAGTDGAVSGLSSNAAMAMNVIGFIYTAYVIADLMVNIIWECEPEEFELGAKKETRQCTYVGSYCASEALGSCVEKREVHCCYSSVVARIIQEQGKPQLGKGFGTAESPSCDAMSIEDMGRINWDAIDLSEWIGMLSITGNLPTINTVDLEQLTGSGSGLGNPEEEGERLNTYDRNIRRLDGIDLDEVKKDAEIEAAGAIPR